MEIRGKRALVTGGANGIGLECVKLLVKNKAQKICIIDNSGDYIKSCSAILEKEIYDCKVVIYECDVSNVKDFEITFQEIVNDNGRIDIVINNAGLFNDSKWEQVIKTNFIGTACCMFLAMQHMREYRSDEDGVIINVSSISALKPIYGCPIYSATKSAIVSMGNSFSAPFYAKNYGIRVMNICPTLTWTGMGTYLMDKFISPSIRDEWFNQIKNIDILCASHVAEEIIKMIRVGQNGATWVCDGDKSSENVTMHIIKSKL